MEGVLEGPKHGPDQGSGDLLPQTPVGESQIGKRGSTIMVFELTVRGTPGIDAGRDLANFVQVYIV